MTSRRIAVLGYGKVGSALAAAFVEAGHRVAFGINPARPDGAAQAKSADPALASVDAMAASEAAAWAEIVVLAVPFAAVADMLTPIREQLDERVLIDATNPVGPGFTHALGDRSGADDIARLAPKAHVVKAFNVYGFENLRRAPQVGNQRSMLPIAGDSTTAKAVVADVAATAGWDVIDTGPLAAALDLEHLALLWIRMVRVGGWPSQLTWAALRG